MTIYRSRKRANGIVSELTPQERAAKIAFELADGRRMTTAEVAETTGLTTMGAWYLMHRVCRVACVRQDDEGRWLRD